MNIEQIKADREWRPLSEGYAVLRDAMRKDATDFEAWQRISPKEAQDIRKDFAEGRDKIPGMRAALIEAVSAMNDIVYRSHDDPLGTSKVIDMREIADTFLKKYTKPD